MKSAERAEALSANIRWLAVPDTVVIETILLLTLLPA